MEWRGMPAALQAFLAFSIEEEMLTEIPRSSSLMRLTKASALARLLKAQNYPGVTQKK